MSDSHFTCEGDSILTRACRKSPSGFCVTHFRWQIRHYSDLGGKPPRRGRMKRLVLAGALAVVAAGQTLASDLPPPSPVPPPRAPAAYMPPITQSITGAAVYFGFNLDYGFGSSKWSDPANFSDQGTTTGDFNLNGFLVGPTIGANFQVDTRPRGLRTRNSWSRRFTSNVGWFAAVTGRVGYAARRSTALPKRSSGLKPILTDPGSTASALRPRRSQHCYRKNSISEMTGCFTPRAAVPGCTSPTQKIFSSRVGSPAARRSSATIAPASPSAPALNSGWLRTSPARSSTTSTISAAETTISGSRRCPSALTSTP